MFRMTLHKTGSSSPWWFTRQRERKFTTLVSFSWKCVCICVHVCVFPLTVSLCSSSADPPPYIDGIRINSPHYLTKMRLTSAGTHTFTLVVSQYEKQNTINYTLRVRHTHTHRIRYIS